MAFNNESQEGGFGQREMIKGKWTCEGCGAEITELPFEPSEGRPVYCKECWRKEATDVRPARWFKEIGSARTAAKKLPNSHSSLLKTDQSTAKNAGSKESPKDLTANH